MYENEIYSGDGAGRYTTGGTESGKLNDSSVNCGSTGNNAANGNANAYFDYIAYPTEDLDKKASMSREARRKREKEERKAAKAERRAKKAQRPSGGILRKAVLSVSLGLCFGLFAGVGFYAVQLGTGQLQQTGGNDTVISNPVKETAAPASSGLTATQVTYVQDDISDVVEEVMPAMVSIVNKQVTTATDFWGQSYQRESSGSGSGIIVAENDDELLIVSNNHVVEGATSLEVTFIDGSTAEASIKGRDSDMDLAVIAVPLSSLSDETKSEITIATLGDSDNLKLGEPVIAIGNALGYGQSVTNGIVSALNRELELEDGSTGIFIQTNAAINPGNSGGALLNINGEVIGINSNKIGATTVEGMGYAIPISSASPIIAELMERQTRNKVADGEVGYMGITMQEITEQIIQMYNMPQGVFVYDVAQGSAAEAAGIKKGDIIVKFDGQKITSSTDLKDALEYYKAGETATVTVKRAVGGEYESIDLEITLGQKPQN